MPARAVLRDMLTVFQVAFSAIALSAGIYLIRQLSRLAPRKPDPVRAEAERGVAELEELLRQEAAKS